MNLPLRYELIFVENNYFFPKKMPKFINTKIVITCLILIWRPEKLEQDHHHWKKKWPKQSRPNPIEILRILISKCIACVFNFFQKMNENTSHGIKNKFIRSFFGRIQGLTICFRNYLTFDLKSIQWGLPIMSQKVTMVCQ